MGSVVIEYRCLGRRGQFAVLGRQTPNHILPLGAESSAPSATGTSAKTAGNAGDADDSALLRSKE